MISSKPNLCGFNPKVIPTQWQVVKLIKKDYDYSHGPAEIMLSGSLGSSKSILMAHLATVHCMSFNKARFLIGRKSMPDLKSTLFNKIKEHIADDLIEGQDFESIDTRGTITFKNGSEIISRSWGDKRFKKFRSLDISAAAIEELTENDDVDKEFYTELIGRVGRIPHIANKECFVIAATNPDSPDHWAYNYFIKGSEEKSNRFVFYSKTSDNPYLPTWYIDSLKDKYDAKMILRLIEGLWIYINSETIYYEYDKKKHVTLNNSKINPMLPICLTYDFNIGENKPMSLLICQYDKLSDEYLIIDEVILDSSRTNDTLEELNSRGYFDISGNPHIKIYGDASGKNRDTRSIKSDYDLIKQFLANYTRKDNQKLNFSVHVPLANPAIRKRHNIVNGCLHNANGRVRIKIDERCKVLDEGLSKVKLIKTGNYTEDDSKPYQHVTTALGYFIVKHEADKNIKPSRVINI